jgi:RNA polymerase sigma-70 factor, ECF subfamily
MSDVTFSWVLLLNTNLQEPFPLAAESEKERLFERILEENKRRIHIFAKANARGDSWKDLEQEILLQVWRSLDRYQGQSNMKTWVYAVAYNTLKYFNRMNHRPETTLESWESIPARFQYAGASDRRDEIQVLEAFIQSLGEVDRTVLLMHLDGCSYREISESTAADEGALRVRIHRLKKQFAKYAES